MEFKSFDPRFPHLIQPPAVLEKLWTGGRWTEGPVWFGDSRTVVFSDIPNDRMLAWSQGGITGGTDGSGSVREFLIYVTTQNQGVEFSKALTADIKHHDIDYQTTNDPDWSAWQDLISRQAKSR